ncbi:MAG: hypothetical protein COU40_02830 [Candidatus Moranbacteria bacterium CG10_big_fil_rev_8_21_14_0_10_35_21]|nr:MAG: hypothetical protein COU40_02830 [Candidatus Moranbacteria bacterium CG10_big_fil_rev_8_21_14_0_10_35_21]
MNFIKKIILGFLAALMALLGEQIISTLYFLFFNQEISENYFEKITPFLFLVVLIEEMFRYLAVKKSSSYSKEIRKYFSPALAIGLGFFLAEIIFRFWDSNILSFFSLEILGIFFLHFIISFLMIIILTAKKNELWKFILPAFVIHFIYNSLIIYNLGGLAVFIYLILISLILAAFYSKNLLIQTS